jgi:hypothetical protein
MAKRSTATRRGERAHGNGTGAVRFVDFSIRAWRDGSFVQVIAHSTPAGAMRQPVATRLGAFSADDYRIAIDAPLACAAEVGRALARILLPPEIWRLLGQSLAEIGPRQDLGLRLRLCLDDDLIDLPWEFLYRPDVQAPAAQSGFLLTDGGISLTREPPSIVGPRLSSDRIQRGLFVGTIWDDDSDGWSVGREFKSLQKAMRPVDRLLDFDFVRADDIRAVEAALADGCEVFHYAGHTDVADGRGTLVHLASSNALRRFDEAVGSGTVSGLAIPESLEALATPAAWAASDVLAIRLAQAGARLAVFNACNSGLWPFVRPLMQAGIPAVIGIQGLVSNLASLNFAEKFYQSLAVGLSVDEALTYARVFVLQQGRYYHPCDWGRFMAYLPSDSAVLFRRPPRGAISQRQQEVRSGREETLAAVPEITRRLDGPGVNRVLSEVASCSVLILGRFSADRKPVLDLIRRELSTGTRDYVPIVFDFDRPKELTMIEAVFRIAAVSRFVIADLSDPKWVLAELQKILTSLPLLPVVPIIQAQQQEDLVIEHVATYRSAHPVVRYRDGAHLRTILDREVLAAAEALYAELRPGGIAAARA